MYFRLRWRLLGRLPDDQVLWRVVCRKGQIKKNGSLKPSFFNDARGLSCELATFTSRRKILNPPRPPGTGLTAFTVGDIRSATDRRCRVRHVPIEKPENNYAHCEVHPVIEPSGRTRMVRLSKYVVEPDRAKLPKD